MNEQEELKKEFERDFDFSFPRIYWSDLVRNVILNFFNKWASTREQALLKEVEGFKNKIYWLENPKTEPSHIWCRFAKEGRGDCEHFIGLPKVENETTTDEYGIPYGWCEYCWSCEKRKRLESELSSSKKREQELREALQVLYEKSITFSLGARVLPQIQESLKEELFNLQDAHVIAKSLLSKLNKPSEGK